MPARIDIGKLRLPALIAVIVIQLLAPVYMVANKYDVMNSGEEYLFIVNPVDPYDAFRGRYVSIHHRINVHGDFKYGIITVGDDGFASVDELTNDKPKSGAYVKSTNSVWFNLPIERYYMNDKLAPRAEQITRNRETIEDAYVSVRIKNGELVVTGLFIDGVAIEDILRNE